MKKTYQIKLVRNILPLLMITLTGCSTVDSYRNSNQTTVRSLPQIPEIKRQQTVKPRQIPPEKSIVTVPVVPEAAVSTYPKPTVQTNNIPQLTKQQQIEAQQRAQQQAKQNATVDIDPYATIPDNNTNQNLKITSTVTTSNSENTGPVTSSSSPATKSLMTSARADIALGRSRSAISKLERGLRIEPQNAQLWHMLAKAHYSNSAYLHSVSMAKKSNSNTNNKDLINENWRLIKQAGERSGNASVIKEALDYMKMNP